MNVTEKVRLETYLTRYNFWLDSRGVPGQIRRGLVGEARSNLLEASADVGLDAALRGIGRPKELADEAAEVAVDPTRPTWLLGCGWALAAGSVYLFSLLLVMLTFSDGVRATGSTQEARGGVLLVPGVEFTARHSPDATSVGMDGFPWLLPVVALIAFVLGAKAWRVFIPAEQRRERVYLPGPERPPNWASGTVAALVAFLLLSLEIRVDEHGFSTSFIASGIGWLLPLAGAAITFALVARPWRATRLGR